MELVCRLCKKPAQLCHSHILPEFLYRPLYDDKHRFSVLTKNVEGYQYLQRGLTERMLCAKCERQLSAHERYAADVMNGCSATDSQGKVHIVLSMESSTSISSYSSFRSCGGRQHRR